MKNLLIFTLSILLSIGVLSSCKEHKNTKKNPLSINVKVISVESMLMNKVVEYSGNILPYKTIKQGFMVSGKVQQK